MKHEHFSLLILAQPFRDSILSLCLQQCCVTWFTATGWNTTDIVWRAFSTSVSVQIFFCGWIKAKTKKVDPPKSSGKPFQISWIVYSSKGGTCSLLMPIDLEWDTSVWRSHDGRHCCTFAFFLFIFFLWWFLCWWEPQINQSCLKFVKFPL